MRPRNKCPSFRAVRLYCITMLLPAPFYPCSLETGRSCINNPYQSMSAYSHHQIKGCSLWTSKPRRAMHPKGRYLSLTAQQCWTSALPSIAPAPLRFNRRAAQDHREWEAECCHSNSVLPTSHAICELSRFHARRNRVYACWISYVKDLIGGAVGSNLRRTSCGGRSYGAKNKDAIGYRWGLRTESLLSRLCAADRDGRIPERCSIPP